MILKKQGVSQATFVEDVKEICYQSCANTTSHAHRERQAMRQTLSYLQHVEESLDEEKYVQYLKTCDQGLTEYQNKVIEQALNPE